LARSEAGKNWEASKASFAARAIDSVSPMRLSRDDETVGTVRM
jgi:hypothetical protein